MKTRIPFDSDEATRAVVRVEDGRGFVMEISEANPRKEKVLYEGKMTRPRPVITRRVIVTAAHLLPNLPPAHGDPRPEDKIYPVVGPLDCETPSIKTECLFANPVADLAILGEADVEVYEEGENEDAFLDLVEEAIALSLTRLTNPLSGWLLSLDNQWAPCTLKLRHGLWISDAVELKCGMSGSPILLKDGGVGGVVSNFVVKDMKTGAGIQGGPQPWLPHALPGWMLAGLRTKVSRNGKKRTEHRP
jgi:hypothetical protein